MEDPGNVLSKWTYLFSPELCAALLSGKFSDREDKNIEKHKKGVYLIFVKTLNKQDKSLTYIYIYYDLEFLGCLLWYFAYIHIYSSSIYNSEWGNYFVITASQYSTEDPYMLNKDYFIIDLLTGAEYKQEFDLVNLINSLIYWTTYERMAQLTRLSFNKSYTEFYTEVLKHSVLQTELDWDLD